ncbi:MAG: RNA polymerase sigma factor [Limisphaerales bacterium]
MNEERTNLAEDFLTLLRPIRRELELYSRRLIWNENDAADAIQNAVMNGFRAFDRYHANTNFRAWMFKILTHEVLKLNRKHGRLAQFEFPVEPSELALFPGCEGSVGDCDWLNSRHALTDALDQELVSALETLTEVERAVLLLRAIGEFRYREIAAALDIPLGSVMGNLSRARLKMRSAIRRSQPRTAP